MRLLMREICEFVKCTPSSRNHIEGESLFNSGHLLYCGKEDDESVYTIIAYCLQTSSMRDNPHEIKGKISLNDSVEMLQCTCKAGLSETCKHIVGVLLHLYRIDLLTLETASCTDKKCLRKIPHKAALESYNPVPLQKHECLKQMFSPVALINLSEELINKLKGKLLKIDDKSPLAKNS